MIDIRPIDPAARALYDKVARFNGFIRYDVESLPRMPAVTTEATGDEMGTRHLR